MRGAQINRKTAETDIRLSLELDGKGKSDIKTGEGFLDHMLELFARHGRFDLTVQAEGDLWVDSHHLTEDVGIALGQAFAKALGEKKGIVRYGLSIIPMDEALILTAIDFSGRSFLCYKADVPAEKIGTFDTELTEEFWQAFARNADCTLHIRKLDGKHSHHIIEGVFKSAARAIREAVKIEEAFADEVPSTKGVL
ncbi:MAG: imidazoleglycerol-phosphate dehydratase HisB [Clostridiales bacterium]|nr:imidazoleglycerol-phosphate dehydratase HisB [Clostridiales bacterium]